VCVPEHHQQALAIHGQGMVIMNRSPINLRMAGDCKTGGHKCNPLHRMVCKNERFEFRQHLLGIFDAGQGHSRIMVRFLKIGLCQFRENGYIQDDSCNPCR